MAEKYTGPDAKLLESPVESLCGSPSERNYSGGKGSNEIYGMKGPEGQMSDVPVVVVYDDIAPRTAADKPSDRDEFTGKG